MVCDLWLVDFDFVCFCVSRFVACDHNYGWRQRKTQLWRRLMNFRVRIFVKSVVIRIILPSQWINDQNKLTQQFPEFFSYSLLVSITSRLPNDGWRHTNLSLVVPYIHTYIHAFFFLESYTINSISTISRKLQTAKIPNHIRLISY